MPPAPGAATGTARALVVTHSPTEGPGTLAEWFPAAGLELVVVDPWDGDELPTDPTAYDALIVLGGPQQAYDDSSAPWLPATKALLRAAVAERVPTLGICLGGQLLAEATGGRVAKGAEGIEAGARLGGRDAERLAEVRLRVGVDEQHAPAAGCEGYREVRGRGGLAAAALVVGEDEHGCFDALLFCCLHAR